MRLALIADIHSNLEALDACLAEIDAASVDKIICLGDIVGYGADPVAVTERMMHLVERGAVCLKGNHDAAVEFGCYGMSAHAERALEWTCQHLGPLTRGFLLDRPLTHREGNLLFVHASAHQPTSWPYVLTAEAARESLNATDAWLVISAHTHIPAVFAAHGDGSITRFQPHAGAKVQLLPDKRYHAVMGAVGQPRDGDHRACWGLLDSLRGELIWRRVAYDVVITMRKILDAGLPPRLATRLELGL